MRYARWAVDVLFCGFALYVAALNVEAGHYLESMMGRYAVVLTAWMAVRTLLTPPTAKP